MLKKKKKRIKKNKIKVGYIMKTQPRLCLKKNKRIKKKNKIKVGYVTKTEPVSVEQFY